MRVKRLKLNDQVEIGDRVFYDGPYYNRYLQQGCLGTVVIVNRAGSDLCRVGVRFDDYIAGHTCNNRATAGHGRNFYANTIANEDISSLMLVLSKYEWKKL